MKTNRKPIMQEPETVGIESVKKLLLTEPKSKEIKAAIKAAEATLSPADQMALMEWSRTRLLTEMELYERLTKAEWKRMGK